MLNSLILADKDNVKQGLNQPYFLIKEALDPKVAEQLYRELLQFANWARDSEKTDQGEGVPELEKDYSYRRQSILASSPQAPTTLAKLNTYLNSAELLSWISDVSGRKCDYFVGSAARFGPGDHITRHNDNLTVTKSDGLIHRRVVTINYWLTPDWLPELGGQFVWETPYAEIVPTFNTMVIFLPGPSTQHWVEPVAESVTAPRLSITGWFSTTYQGGGGNLRLNLG
jgi:Rps23 Pro-64 3,4-dihydroxylase Tpa1-like proline 4-hydroxylase